MLSLIVFVASMLLVQATGVLAQTKAECLGCHSSAMTMVKGGRTISLQVSETDLNKSPHSKLVCIACHTGFDITKTPHKAKIEPVSCVNCHRDAAGKHSFHKDIIKTKGSIAERNASCKMCHGTHGVNVHLPQTCGSCHVSEKQIYVGSAHGKAYAAGVRGAPTCFDCHKNSIVANGDGRSEAQLKIAQERACVGCHVENAGVRQAELTGAGFVASYEKSVHGRALYKGNGSAPNCISCHGNHDIRKASDPASGVNKANIPTTCGQCHDGIAKDYSESIHGKAIAKGNSDAPVCTSCHGEHQILPPSDPKSPVAPRNVAAQVCGTCHGSVQLSEKYGIASDRFETFSDSYHGLALRGGSLRAANCTSCHGVHNIRPSSDPASMINKANIPHTCGKCHPGANKQFAVGKVHVTVTPRQEPVLYIISVLYILMIVGVVGGMFAHNMLDLLKKWRRHMDKHTLHDVYVRMSLSERVQHAMMMSSFIVLVFTGFMLHYPDAWWVKWIRDISPHVFDLRSILHRVAAVVMIASTLIHGYYILLTPRGKQLLRDLLPKLQDARDPIALVKYNLGLLRDKPKFGRFSYIEKSEYWALVWGTIVMTVTGIIMWYENTFIGLLSKLGWDIARTIHFWEAWLAALAILVWHIYFVVFNPDVYPMNGAWITGTLPEEVLEEEHPLEYEALLEKEGQSGLKGKSQDAEKE